MPTTQHLQDGIDKRISTFHGVMDASYRLLDSMYGALSVLNDDCAVSTCMAYSEQLNEAIECVKKIVQISESACSDYSHIREMLIEPIPPILEELKF